MQGGKEEFLVGIKAGEQALPMRTGPVIQTGIFRDLTDAHGGKEVVAFGNFKAVLRKGIVFHPAQLLRFRDGMADLPVEIVAEILERMILPHELGADNALEAFGI